jgi:hypothetical protein
MQTETDHQTIAPELAPIMKALIREEERGAKRALQVIVDHSDIFAKPVAEATLGAIMSPLHEWTLADIPQSRKQEWHRELDLIKQEIGAIGIAAAGIVPETPAVPRYSKAFAPVDALASAREFRLKVESISQMARAGKTSAACEALIHTAFAAVTCRLPRLSSSPLGCEEINARAARIALEGVEVLRASIDAQRFVKRVLN